jgi:hypothetical protein
VITARTLGIYYYLATTGAPATSEALSRVFGGDRKTYLKDLRSLKEAGLLDTRREVVNGKLITVTRLSDQSPKNGLQILLSQLNSNKSLIAYSFNSKPNGERSSREGDRMEYFEDEDERLEAQRKWREKQHKEKLEAHERRRQTQMARRNPANAHAWTTTDSSFEFAEQMHTIWHIQPWKVTRSRFRFALAEKRKEYNTDGSIERVMMSLFFDSIRHDTKLSDPELVWKRFIMNFENLLTEARRTMVTPEDIAEERELYSKTRDWLDDVQP